MSVLGAVHRANQMLEGLKRANQVCPIECSNAGNETDIVQIFKTI